VRLPFRQLRHSRTGRLELARVPRELTPRGPLPHERGHPGPRPLSLLRQRSLPGVGPLTPRGLASWGEARAALQPSRGSVCLSCRLAPADPPSRTHRDRGFPPKPTSPPWGTPAFRGKGPACSPCPPVAPAQPVSRQHWAVSPVSSRLQAAEVLVPACRAGSVRCGSCLLRAGEPLARRCWVRVPGFLWGLGLSREPPQQLRAASSPRACKQQPFSELLF